MYHIFQTPYAGARHYDEAKNPNPNYKEVPKVVSFLLLQANNYLSCVLFIR